MAKRVKIYEGVAEIRKPNDLTNYTALDFVLRGTFKLTAGYFFLILEVVPYLNFNNKFN